MGEVVHSPGLVRFGNFEVDLRAGEVRKSGVKLKLTGQPFQVLAILLERPGEVVTREDLQKRLWPDTFVDVDHNLNTAINKIREVLGDSAETPRFVETLPRRGYRFIAPVELHPSKVLEKDNELGYLHAADSPRGGSPSSAAIRVSKVSHRTYWAVGLGLVLSFLLGRLVHTGSIGADGVSGQQLPRPIRASVQPPSNWSFEHSSFSISPDGTRLAFVAVGPDGTDKLWVRAFSAANAQQITGTDGALLPFWSPDGRRIGFFAAGKLNIVDLESGAVRVLCEAPFGRGGGAWGRNGTIVFSPSVSGPLYRIPDSGGVPVPITRMTPASASQHMWPFFLPDGTHFLYSDFSGPMNIQGENIYLGSLDGSDPKLISSKIAGNVAYDSGYLLYSRDYSLWAQPFDLRRLELSGTARSITSQEIDQELSFSHAEFSVSQNGMLVFQSLADSRARLAWFDASGKELGQVSESGYQYPRLSPDGRFLAVSSDDARNGKLFIRVYDLLRGIPARLTDGGADRDSAWSPDGKRITYRTPDALKEVPADGSSPPQVLLKGGVYLGHPDWSSDGHLVFTDFSAAFLR